MAYTNRSVGEPEISSTDAVYEVMAGELQWSIPEVSASDPSGSLDFTCKGDAEDDFYPIAVKFSKSMPFCGVDVREVTLTELGEDVSFAKEARTLVDRYTIS